MVNPPRGRPGKRGPVGLARGASSQWLRLEERLRTVFLLLSGARIGMFARHSGTGALTNDRFPSAQTGILRPFFPVTLEACQLSRALLTYTSLLIGSAVGLGNPSDDSGARISVQGRKGGERGIGCRLGFCHLQNQSRCHPAFYGDRTSMATRSVCG